MMDSVTVTANNEIYCPVEDASFEGFILPEYIRQEMSTWKDSVAFESPESGVSYTYSQVMEHSRAFATSLIKQGYSKGDVIGVVLPNIPEYGSIIFGIWEAGLVASPTNPMYTEEELTYQFNLCGIKAVIANKDMLEKLHSISCVEKIIVMGEISEGCTASYHEMIQTDTTGMRLSMGSAINTKTETALILFSSGTTGLPKGVMLTHENVTVNAVQFKNQSVIASIKNFDVESGQERTIAVLPFFHAYGFQTVLTQSMLKGAHIVTLTKFLPALFLKALRQHRPTFLCLVPTVINFLLSEQVAVEDLTSLHTIILGGAAISQETTIKFGKKCSALILLGYGLTELSPASHVCRRPKLGSIGLPLPMTWVKVIDIQSGDTVGRNVQGEICVKGPQVMKGYYNNEAATKATIDEDGWLHTGDCGYYDDDNYFFIVDRIKDIIKVKGFQVSPTEMENLLKTHSKIADTAVIGIPDSSAGELPRAYVVAKEGMNISEEELHGFIKNRVAAFKQLRGGIEFVDQIPRNPTGKILRKELVKCYVESSNSD
ncbi:unnamed protein product [Allacma fusca]|uniref:4-coumarate--CoA ligase n=1 Tax=Allacma fusca TaxID=39272 RepID=A0A8J2PMP9_9HEXA|nr:unnamed protein product [Allacma fusca]